MFLSSLVKQEVDLLPRGLKSSFSLRQQSSASSYHSLSVTSVLRAAVDELRSVGKQGRHACDSCRVDMYRLRLNYTLQTMMPLPG